MESAQSDENLFKQSFWRRMIGSCYNRQIYRPALLEPSRRSVIYLLKILFIGLIIFSLSITATSWPVIQTVGDNLAQQLPRVIFHNGELEVEGETPRRVELYADQQLVIDPAGQVSRARLEDEVVVVLVNGAVFFRSPGGEFNYRSTRLYEKTADAPEIVISPNWLEARLFYLKILALSLVILSSSFDFLLITLSRLVLISFGGLLARQKESPVALKWAEILRISCYTVTPTIGFHLLFRILQAINLSLPAPEFVMILAGTGWTYLVVKQVEEEAASRPPSRPIKKLVEQLDERRNNP